VVLDNDATQQLAGDSDALDVLRRAVRDGRLELLATHVLRDEVAAWRNARKRARKEALLADAVDVPTGGIIFNQSKFDQMAFAPDDEAFERLMRGDGKRHGHDALISSTALAQNAALVSCDNEAIRAARAEGIEILSPLELLVEMGFDPT
jgi:hypothetical protein